MEVDQIIKEVNDIFIDVLDDEDIVIERSTTADDIEEWDSLNHVLLVVGVEKHFNIKFTAFEIQSYKDVGEMCDAIKVKLENE